MYENIIRKFDGRSKRKFDKHYINYNEQLNLIKFMKNWKQSLTNYWKNKWAFEKKLIKNSYFLIIYHSKVGMRLNEMPSGYKHMRESYRLDNTAEIRSLRGFIHCLHLQIGLELSYILSFTIWYFPAY